MLAAAVLSSIRPVEGIPKEVAIWGYGSAAVSLIFAVFVPGGISLTIVKRSYARIYFLGCLAVAALAWYATGFEDMLIKAWERGL